MANSGTVADAPRGQSHTTRVHRQRDLWVRVSKAAAPKHGTRLMIEFPNAHLSVILTVVAGRQRHSLLGHSELQAGNDA